MKIGKIGPWLLVLGILYLCLLLYFPSIRSTIDKVFQFRPIKKDQETYYLPKQIKPLIKDRPLRIWFEDFWESFTIKQNIFIDIIEHYSQDYVIDSENPDILFYSVFGMKHLDKKYQNVAKIQYTGESYETTKGSEHDLILGFDDSAPNKIRFPMWYLCIPWFKPEQVRSSIDRNTAEYQKKLQNKTKFAAFLYSNAKSGKRIQLFHRLSETYKKVDSGGLLLNNLGYTVENKFDFYQQYKFVIAYENTQVAGYATEKILHSLQSGAIPIYFGNKDITKDFNRKAFINAHDFQSLDDLINEIIRIDSNQTLFDQMVKEPIFNYENKNMEEYFDGLWDRISVHYQNSNKS